MRVLWAADASLTPGEVRDRLDADLAYTTVMTVLVRLNDKGMVDRELRGRAYAYHPTVTESQLVAERMADALSSTGDRVGALGGFVGGLDRRDLAVLRRLIDGSD